MKIGTKSLLFGAHQVLIHPWFVALAWWKLYGFPWDVRLWVAFFAHDLGYWGKSDMDGSEGELHPLLGANILHFLFGHQQEQDDASLGCCPYMDVRSKARSWWDFSFYHSRSLASRDNVRPSKLCYADKLSIVLMPAWLYLPLVRASGEIHEYMSRCEPKGKYAHMQLRNDTQQHWFHDVRAWLRKWVEENSVKVNE